MKSSYVSNVNAREIRERDSREVRSGQGGQLGSIAVRFGFSFWGPGCFTENVNLRHVISMYYLVRTNSKNKIFK